MNLKKIKLTVLIILICCVASAQQREIKVDINNVKGNLSQTFKNCVGAGRASEGLRADWQEQLKIVQSQIGFKYIRFHGLLCDEMGVYFEDKKGNPIYNWQYIDKLYDFLLSVKIKPFVELSFMPSALASGDKTVFWWKANVTPPKDYKKWDDLIVAMVKHLELRYGKEEVKTWPFEVWNEPDHPAFLYPNKFDTYIELYKHTAEAIKSVSKDYVVGGPATAGPQWIPEFINYCSTNKIPLDFISTHNYGVIGGNGLDEFGDKNLRVAPNLNTIPTNVSNAKKVIENSQLPNLPLHFTEWSTSYSAVDLVHDTYFNAAYVLNVLKKTQDNVTSMSYWTFTDIFEEHGPPQTPFHGGFGIMNLQNIKKPTFYAFKYLNELSNIELVTKDSFSIVCKDKKGNIQALFWNLTGIDYKNSFNRDFFSKEVPAKNIKNVELEINNLKPGKYEVEVYKIGYKMNDAYTKYIEMGKPSQITKVQENILKEVSSNKPSETFSINVKEGTFKKVFFQRENDVFFVKINRKL